MKATGLFVPLVLILPLMTTGQVLADDVYYHMPIKELTLTEGKWPDTTAQASDHVSWQTHQLQWDFGCPYAIGNRDEEIYVYVSNDRGNLFWDTSSENFDDIKIAIRAPSGGSPAGKLFIPIASGTDDVGLTFNVTDPPLDQTVKRKEFLRAKEQHYQRLLEMDIPGAAWFRHQMRQARYAHSGGEDETDMAGNIARRRRGRRRGDLEDTFDLFSGGRAISENLQLDRELRVVKSGEATISVDEIEGITIAEFDWQQQIQGLDPRKDFLAGSIPADQYGLFFPSFEAMARVVDEAKSNGTPILRLLESRSEDALSHQQFEQQLCVSLDALTRLIGPKLVSGVVLTGSDPYLRTGTDIAVLFESEDVKALSTLIKVRQAAGAAGFADAKPANGSIAGVSYTGVKTPDRRVCSYLAVVDRIVILSNSLYQLEQVIKTNAGQVKAITALESFTFFRDRYQLGDKNEAALLIVPDAAIRKWCGPRWRIVASRRTRTAAVLAELQARYLDHRAAGEILQGPVELKSPPTGLGELRHTADGLFSSVYGTLNFLTPIAELDCAKVSQTEHDAYVRFRDNYQRQWRQFFDPIAVRFNVLPDRLGLDMTVMPLIADSEYREWISVTGDGHITSKAGDPHAEALAQVVFSVDIDAPSVQRWGNMAMVMLPGVDNNALSWIGQWLTVYVDEDPLWSELQKVVSEKGQRGAEDFMENQFHRLPIALQVDVANGFKLTGFLVALRGIIEQTAPDMTVWENFKHNDRTYVKISPSASIRADMGDSEAFQELAVYYAATPSRFILTLNEPLLKRALDRLASAKQTPAESQTDNLEPGPWLGQSVAAHVKESALGMLQTMYSENLVATCRRRSWSNLPILNEWRRRYGKQQPVDFHQQYWQTRLVCPGDGKYLWNEKYQTMESTVFGHPGQPAKDPQMGRVWFNFMAAKFGLTFENNGLRTRGELKRKVDSKSN
jgi:hypothetical protein